MGRLPDPTGCHQSPSPGMLQGLAAGALCPQLGPNGVCHSPEGRHTPHDCPLLRKACLELAQSPSPLGPKAGVLEPFCETSPGLSMRSLSQEATPLTSTTRQAPLLNHRARKGCPWSLDKPGLHLSPCGGPQSTRGRCLRSLDCPYWGRTLKDNLSCPQLQGTSTSSNTLLQIRGDSPC